MSPRRIEPVESREIQRVHVEDHGDVLGQAGLCQDLLDMVGEGAGAVGTEGDLETELAVRADEGRRQHFAEGDTVRKIFREAEMQGLQCEFGAALVGRAGC